MGDPWDINNFKQAFVAEKGTNYKPTFGAMRHSPTNERGVIADVKVIDVEKRRAKEHSNSKNYVCIILRAIYAWFSCCLSVILRSVLPGDLKLICEREIQIDFIVSPRTFTGIRVESQMVGRKPILHISSL